MQSKSADYRIIEKLPKLTDEQMNDLTSETFFSIHHALEDNTATTVEDLCCQKPYRLTSDRAACYYTDHHGWRETNRRPFGFCFETEDELRRTYVGRNQNWERERSRFQDRRPLNDDPKRPLENDGNVPQCTS